MTTTKLENLRNDIDNIDEKLIELLEDRMSLVDHICQAKKEAGITEPFDPKRETNLLKRVRKLGKQKLASNEIDKVFLQILSISRQRQRERKICVFGEKNGWVDDAALSRFGGCATISTVENTEDFLSQTEAENLGFACVTPQFSADRGAILESLLSGKISIIEEFSYSPEFSIVSNSARDLSEVHELCVTNEMLKLLRSYFISMSYDLKIKICRSTSEAYESLKSINPVAAILPSNLVRGRTDLVKIEENLKSDLLGPVKFMIFAKTPGKDFSKNMKTTILCAINQDGDKLWEMLAVIKTFNLKIFDIQTTDFDGKPWKKLTSIELSTPDTREELDRMVKELERKCVLVKACGIYPEFF